MKMDNLHINVIVKLSLWSAIKLRIAGVTTTNKNKITIDEIINNNHPNRSLAKKDYLNCNNIKYVK